MGNLVENIEKVNLLKQIEELKKDNEFLRNLLDRKVSSSSISAYKIVSEMADNKIYNEVKEDVARKIKTSLRRKLMKDLQWDLRVKEKEDFTKEHIQPSEEYIKNYQFDKQYTKPVAIPVFELNID